MSPQDNEFLVRENNFDRTKKDKNSSRATFFLRAKDICARAPRLAVSEDAEDALPRLITQLGGTRSS